MTARLSLGTVATARLSLFAALAAAAAAAAAAGRVDSVELCFIVSGANDFGGHSGRMFERTISHALDMITRNFEAIAPNGRIDVAAFWTQPGDDEVGAFDRVLSLTSAAGFRRRLVDFTANAPSSSSLSIGSGFATALDFAVEAIFSEPRQQTAQVVVALTHFNIIGSEIAKFLHQRCRTVVVYALVYPYLPAAEEKCLLKRVGRRIENFQKQIVKSARLLQRYNFSMCGFDANAVQQFHLNLLQVAPIIWDNAGFGCQNNERAVTAATTRAPEDADSSAPPPPACQGVQCATLLVCLAAFVSLGVLCTMPIIVMNLYEQLKPRPPPPTISVLLAAHFASLEGQMRAVYQSHLNAPKPKKGRRSTMVAQLFTGKPKSASRSRATQRKAQSVLNLQANDLEPPSKAAKLLGMNQDDVSAVRMSKGKLAVRAASLPERRTLTPSFA